MTRLARAFAVGLIAASASIAFAADSLPEGDWIDVPLLESRLVARMPPEAKAGAFSPGLMSGPQSTAQVHRVVMDLGTIRIVIMATELFRTSKEDMAPAAAIIAGELRGELKIPDPKVRALPSGEGVTVEFIEPDRFIPRGDANLVAAALVRQRDATLQLLRIYTNGPGTEAPDKVKAIALAVAGSIKAGTRTMQSGGRFTNSDSPFEFDLPAGFTCYHQRSYDFTVDHVVRLVEMGAPSSTLGVYAGGHPQKRSSPADARSTKSTLFGREAEWMLWSNDSGQHAETFLANGTVTWHAFIHAGSEADRAALLEAAAKSKVR
jgi:hypothetical protein